MAKQIVTDKNARSVTTSFHVAKKTTENNLESLTGNFELGTRLKVSRVIKKLLG